MVLHLLYQLRKRCSEFGADVIVVIHSESNPAPISWFGLPAWMEVVCFTIILAAISLVLSILLKGDDFDVEQWVKIPLPICLLISSIGACLKIKELP